MTTLDIAFKKLMVQVIKEELEKMNLQTKAKRNPRKAKAPVSIEQKVVMTKETRREDKLGRVISPRKKRRSDFGTKRSPEATHNIRVANAKWQSARQLKKKIEQLSS